MTEEINWRAPSRVPAGCESLLSNITCRNLNTICGGVPCQKPDGDGRLRLEADHIIPRSKGGTDAPYNIGLVCADYNRRKYNNPDPVYSTHCYFDNVINTHNLRAHQIDKGYGLVVGEYRELFEEPGVALTRWIILAWLVGAGKTVGMLAILFGINHVRSAMNGGAVRRIKKVLWLVHQEALVTSLSEEIKTELSKLNICDVKPRVDVVKNRAHWSYSSDVIVACPQAIWDNDSNKLSEREIGEILANFDAIIVDEGHFAVSRYLQLSRLAPHAFKFAVTATPMNASGELFPEIDDGKYADAFALFSTVWYKVGHECGIYKDVLPFDDGLNVTYFPTVQPSQSTIRNGDGVILTDGPSDSENNFPRDKFIIEEANRIAEQSDIVTGYHNHVMLRVDTINRAKHLTRSLENSLSITGVWSGAKGPNLGDESHPWMKTKAQRGKKHKDAKRIVITVDIGQFGINNKYCSIVGWIKPNFSLVEVIQRIGRAIRSAGVEGDCVKLIWDGNETEFTEKVREAINYILNGEELVKASFTSLSNFTEGAISVAPPDVAARLNRVTRTDLIETFGRHLANGGSLSSAADLTHIEWVTNNPNASPKAGAAVQRFMQALSSGEGFEQTLSQTLHLPEALSAHHPDIVLENFAALEFSVDMLRSEIIHGRIMYVPGQSESEDYRRNVADQLLVSKYMVDQATKELRGIHQKSMSIESAHTIPPLLILTASPSKWRAAGYADMWSYSQDLVFEYSRIFKDGGFKAGKYGIEYDLYHIFNRALCSAAARYFNLKSFSRTEYQPFEKALSDALVRQPAIAHIQARAKHIVASQYPSILIGHNEVLRRLGVATDQSEVAA